MYNVDDAIAKIDGYVISISGGGPFVGERKLIRINEVKRTAAYASLVSDNGAGRGATVETRAAPSVVSSTERVAERRPRRDAGAAESEDGDEQVESAGSTGKRRRGRRGGRRRSRAKTGNGSSS